MADAAVGRGVRFRPLDADEKARVKATLSELVTVANPLDYHTFVWGEGGGDGRDFRRDDRLRLRPLHAGARFPARRPLRAMPTGTSPSRAIRTAARATGGRAAVVATLPENMPEERAAAFLAAGIAPLCGIEEAHRRGRGGRIHRRGAGKSRCRAGSAEACSTGEASPCAATRRRNSAAWRPALVPSHCFAAEARRKRSAAVHARCRKRRRSGAGRLRRAGSGGARRLQCGRGGRGGGGARLSGRREGARRGAQERGGRACG